MRPVQRRGLPGKVLAALRDPMTVLLLGAAGLTTAQGDVPDTLVIALVVVLNTGVGVVQEVRAERAVTALRGMAAPLARVLRDGRPVVVPSAEVVPGDVAVLEGGDIVPADAEVLEEHLLQTDDSALTGESVPVPKPPGSTVSAGTTVTRGRGMALVQATGDASSLGQIAALVASARPGPTPLQRRLTRLGQQLTLAAVAVSAVVMALSLLRGVALHDAVLSAASLAVAAVPESLPAVLTLSLALGAHRMARRAAIARELRAVETLGAVTLLATDKTGTLTENRMVVERCWTPAGEYAVVGEGYSPDGFLTGDVEGDPDLPRLLRDVAICNDADIQPGTGSTDGTTGWRPVGDPTEAALVTLAHRGGVDVTAVRQALPRVGELPFESERAWMATWHEVPGGRRRVVCKGAPEKLLGSLPPGPDADRARVWSDAAAAEGFRVLLVADAEGDQQDVGLVGEQLPPGLRLAGLVAMTDPPRRDVPEVLRALAGAGIRVVVMTGDHPATARAVAERVGLVDGDATVPTGAELDQWHRAGVGPVLDAAVYARVRPEHKLDLVQRWTSNGEVVAVTGDGVNDGPALRTAAIGVAMGAGGTEVARQAADLILTDDRLATVVAAVEEGRRIQDNLRRFLRYALSGGFAEVLVMLLAPLAGFVVPLLPGQILWINMLTHGLPGVAMGAEPVAPGAMQRRPVPAGAPVVDRALAARIAVGGALIAAVSIAAAVLARENGASGRTAAFLVLGLAQLGVAIALRERGAAGGNRFLSGAVAVAVGLQVAAVVAWPLRALLETHPLPMSVWVVSVLLALVPAVLLRLGGRLGSRGR